MSKEFCDTEPEIHGRNGLNFKAIGAKRCGLPLASLALITVKRPGIMGNAGKCLVESKTQALGQIHHPVSSSSVTNNLEPHRMTSNIM